MKIAVNKPKKLKFGLCCQFFDYRFDQCYLFDEGECVFFKDKCPLILNDKIILQVKEVN